MGEQQTQWWSSDTVAVVTGGNKGIGYEIVRGLAKHGVSTILTARSEVRGREAVESLKQEHRLNVQFHKLDVTSDASIDDFAAWLKTSFSTGIDILVNNAGVSGVALGFNTPRLQAARDVLETNYHGVRKVTEKLLPLMKDGGRIVNISSGTSRLDNVKDEFLRGELDKVEKLSMETIESMVSAYLEDVKQGREGERGWPGFFGNHDYCVSKVIMNAYSRLLARELAAQGRNVFVNCMCPGLTSTDMTSKTGHSAEVGADTAVWLALLPAAKSPSGKFFTKRTDVGFMQMPFYKNDVFVFPLEEVGALIQAEFSKMLENSGT